MPRLRRLPPRFRRLSLTRLEDRITPASFLVTSSSDGGPGSLRQALLDSNANNQADTITFAPGISLIELTSGELLVNNDLNGLSIEGPGASALTIRSVQATAGATNRVLRVDVAGGSAPISMSGVTLSGGNLSGSNSGAGLAIADEAVTLTNVRFVGNQATSTGAGLAITAAGGQITIQDCEFVGNTSSNNGGAISIQAAAQVTINDSRFEKNSASRGGAIALSNSITHDIKVNRCVITGNVSSGGRGAGVYALGSGSLTVSGSWISQNSATTTSNAAGIYSTVTTRIIGTTVADNIGRGLEYAGSSRLLEVWNSTIVDNHGVGLWRGSGSVTINGTVIARNSFAFAPTDINSSAAVTINGGNNFIGVGLSSTLNFAGANNQIGSWSVPLDPMLMKLPHSLGGAAPVYMALPGSPLIDAGNNLLALSEDQRGVGYPRVIGASADVGAVEGVHVAPHAVATTLPLLMTAGGDRHRVSVTFTHGSGIDTASLDGQDLRIEGPGGTLAVEFVAARTTPAGLLAEYDVLPPDGTWDSADAGEYRVSVEANQVLSLDAPQSASAPVPLGTLRVDSGPILTVDSLGDESDGNFGPGQLTLREAIAIANATTDVVETVRFAPSLWGNSIILKAGITINDRIAIDGPGNDRITITNSQAGNLFNIDAPDNHLPSLVAGLTISGATAPAGVNTGLFLISSDTVDFDRLRFVENDITGSDVLRMTGGRATIRNSEFLNNRGSHSVIDAVATQVFVERTLFAGNSGLSAITFSSGRLSLIDSTLIGNTSSGTGGAVNAAGIGAKLLNNTIVGNTASAGGGMHLSATSLTVIRNTIVGNSAGSAATAGGLSLAGSGNQHYFEGNLVAGNFGVTHPDLFVNNGTTIYNVASFFGAIGSITATLAGSITAGTLASPLDAKLAPLGYYGGDTQTRPPLSGSPVLNLGGGTAGAEFDVRGPGYPRLVGTDADAGSVEGVFVGPHIASVASIEVVPNSSSLSVTVTYAGSEVIDVASIDTADVFITSPWLDTPIQAESADIISAGATTTVTYGFPAPGGTWDRNDNHAGYRIRLLGGQVQDQLGRFVPATPIASFGVHVPISIIVDTLADTIDPNDGKTSFREAISLASVGTKAIKTVDTITFASALHGGTITLAMGELLVTDPVAILGPGPESLTIHASGMSRHLLISSIGVGATTVSGLRLVSGSTSTSGGSIFVSSGSLTIANSVFEANTAFTSGGAIAVATGGAVVIAETRFDANFAQGMGSLFEGGGAIAGLSGASFYISRSQFLGNTSGMNGGAIILNKGDAAVIESTTIVNNSTNGSGISSSGGGIRVSNGSLNLINSLILGNTVLAQKSATGGGLGIGTDRAIQILNSTITGNSAALSGAGVYIAGSVPGLQIESSIIAQNRNAGLSDLYSTASLTVSGSNNLIGILAYSNLTFSNANQVGSLAQPIDAKLSPPNIYGGSRISVAPLAGSPAIDAGSNPLNLTTDTRGAGFARVAGVAADVGAFESPLTFPHVASVSLPDVGGIGATQFVAAVTYLATANIDPASIGIDDIRLSGPGIVGEMTPSTVSVIGVPGGVRAEYTFVAPGGVWETKHNGLHSVRLVDAQVRDLDSPANTLSGWLLGQFHVRVPKVYVVDKLGDTDDGNHAAGQLTFAEAVGLANSSVGFHDTITFDASVFHTPQSLIGALTITDSVIIDGSGVSVTVGHGLSIGDGVDSNVLSVTIRNLTFSGAYGLYGGALRNYGEHLTVDRVSIIGNRAAKDGAGVYSVDGSLTIENSILANNSAWHSLNQGQPSGGGIFGSGLLTIRNSTLTGNSATRSGGAINWNGTATIVNSTITGNRAERGGGVANSGNTTLRSSIVADNTASLNGMDVLYGTFFADRSLIGVVGDWWQTTVTLSDSLSGTLVYPLLPRLSSLGYHNGSPILTMAPLPGSPVIDAGSNDLALPYDQRGPGHPRVIGAAADIGAHEGLSNLPTHVNVTLPPYFISGATSSEFTVTYLDASGIDVSTLGTGDFTVTGPAGFVTTASLVGFQSAAGSTSVAATYSFTPPGGSWDATDSGTYSVTLNANQVFDQDLPANAAPTGSVGSFNVSPVVRYHVDNTAVNSDGNYGAGQLSFNEAIQLANKSKNSQDVITFEPTLFSGKTIEWGGFTLTDPVRIIGPAGGLTLRSNSPYDRNFSVNIHQNVHQLDVIISGLSFENGSTLNGQDGGAILVTRGKLYLSDSRISGAKATGRGGAIATANSYSAQLFLTDVTITANSAGSSGGGIHSQGPTSLTRTVVDGNTAAGNGGGLFLTSSTTVLESSIVNNVNHGPAGGGIYWHGSYNSLLTLANSTLSGNTAAGSGGGLWVAESIVRLYNSTVADNSATIAGGGLSTFDDANLQLMSTIVANNRAGAAPDIAGIVTLAHSSLIRVAPATILAGSNNLIGHDAKLLPLGSAGGPRPAHALAPGSPARDVGNNVIGATIDQLGGPRTLGSQVDMGAVESVDTTPTAAIAELAPIELSTTGYTFVVSFRDDVGIDVASLGTGDLVVTGPGGFAVDATLVGVEPSGVDSPRRATFSFPAPGGTWNAADIGEYTISVVPGSILDLDTPTRAVPAGPLASIHLIPVSTFVVDELTDVVDGTYSSGKLSLREAIALANLNPTVPSTITFDPALFATPRTLKINAPFAVGGPLTLTGPGSGKLTLSSISNDRAFVVAPGGGSVNDVTISGLSITGGFTAGSGGAIFTVHTRLKVIDSVLYANTATKGGAIAISDSTLTVQRTTLRHNSASVSGGSIAVLSGQLQLIESTAHGNRAGISGGAILSEAGQVLVSNSTLSGNTAIVRGGAIDQPVAIGATGFSAPILRIKNATIYQNSAGTGGGVDQFRVGTTGGSSVEVVSSIVTGNSSPDGFDLRTSGYAGIYFSAIGNVTAHANSDYGNNRPFGESPMLGPLSDNGGPTQSHLPLYGSPLKDSGTNVDALTHDQRGLPRLVGPSVDIGSVEAQVDRPFASATLSPVNLAGATQHIIAVTWSHPLAIDVSTLGDADLTLTGPNGYAAAATLVSVDQPDNGSPRVATYVFTPPGGSWDVHDAGLYTLTANAGAVSGVDGLLNLTATVGDFTVGMAGTLVVTNSDTSGPGSFADMVARANANPFDETIAFDPVHFATSRVITTTGSTFLTSNIAIQGPGGDRVTFLNSKHNADVLLIGAGTTASISGVTLDLAGGRGISSYQASLSVDNVIVRGAYNGRAFIVNEGASFQLTNSVLTGGGGTNPLVIASKLNSVTLRDVLVQDSTDRGIIITDAGQILIERVTDARTLGTYLHASGPVVVRNSTFVDGTYGLVVGGTGPVTALIDSTTIVGHKNSGFVGLTIDDGIPAMIRNSVVTSNTSTQGSVINNLRGNMIVASHSLIGPGSSPLLPGSHSNLPANTDPLLSPLADNGGGVLTRAPLPGSPLINAGANAAGLPTDQRGFPRVANGNADIGAVEGLRAAPQGIAVIPTAPTLGTTESLLMVTYHDDLAIAAASIDSSDILVAGPSGFFQFAQLVALDDSSNGTPRIATYRIVAPGGTWNDADNGDYTVTLVAGAVTDTTLISNPAQVLGTIKVAFSQSLVVTTDADSGPGSLRAAITQANSITVPDVITFDPVYFATPRTIKLTSGELIVTDDLTISGPGEGLITISGEQLSRIIVANGATPIRVGIAGLTLANGNGQGIVAPGTGGAILAGDDTIHISNSLLYGNSSTTGGAIRVLAGGTLRIEDSTLRDNSASGSGGAISLVAFGEVVVSRSTLRTNTASSNGGAIAIEPSASTGRLLVSESLFAGNSTGHRGGGLYLSTSNAVASADVRNSTFSNNHAWTTAGGAYIRLPSFQTFSVFNSTIVGNTAGNPDTNLLRGGGIEHVLGKLTVDSSIIAGNDASMAPDIASSLGFIARNSAFGTSAFFVLNPGSEQNLPIGVDLKLGPLTDNGGPTQSHALLVDSPAINAGSNPLGLLTDQRGPGYSRVVGAAPDIGAYEYQAAGAAGPLTASIVVNDGDAQRSQLTSLRVTFSQPVTFPFGVAAAIRLDRDTPNLSVPLAFEQVGNTIIIDFKSAPFVLSNGSLPDGRYTLKISATQLAGGGFDGNGDGTPGDDLTTSIHRLFGDANGDAIVDSADFLAFRLAFLTSSEVFDFDDDGQVGAVDFLNFRMRFLQSV